MKNFLVFIKYTAPIEQVEARTPEHREYLKAQYAKGLLLVSGPYVPRTAGVLWAQASDRSEIEEMTSQDPFFTHGIADYEIQEWKPVMFADILQPVFQAQDISVGRN